jgi:tetratricopeptide (TPR) repeat protein
VLSRLRRFTEAIESHQRCLVIARELRDRNREGGTHVNLGIAYHETGRLDEAQRHLERGREILREIGNRSWEANAIANLATVHQARGHLAKSVALERRFLELKIETGDRPWEAGANGRLAARLLALGRMDEARRLAERAATLAHEIGGMWESAAYWDEATSARARDDAEDAERAYRTIAERDGAADDDRASALLAIARLRPDAAVEVLREAPASETPEFSILAPALLGDAAGARAALEEHGTAAGARTCMEAHFRIGEVEKAHELLMHLREHAPEDCRESMIENVPLHREIMEAWNDR